MAGIYVHIPFCSQACHYCDFHFSTSFKNKTEVVKSIQKELSIEKKYLKGETINTIYFGGGTPSILDVESIDSILNTIKNNFELSDGIECTIEANPEDVEISKIEEWYSIGINRVSLGAQSFRDKDLIYMNRSHNKDQAIKAIEIIKKSRIKKMNVDLIYGFPLLNNSAWLKNLQTVINLNVPHLSCYCLTVEPNTPLFYFIKNKQSKSLNENVAKEQFLIAREILIKNGYDHYEISNFSKEGCYSIHNQNYWNSTNYLGVGPSAHSFNGLSRRWNIKNNNIYLKKIRRGECIYEEEELSKQNIINEYILTNIRTKFGLNLDLLYNKMNNKEQNNFNQEINKLEKKKLIELKEGMLYLNEEGMLLADSISQKLFLI